MRIPQGTDEPRGAGSSAGAADGTRALQTGAALVDRHDRGVLRLDGAERRSFLQGLLTNDVLALAPGDACYAALLTPQGRMIADMHVLETGEYVLLDVARRQAAALASRFEMSIFAEDVSVRDVTDDCGRLAVAGPEAPRVVERAMQVVSGVRRFIDSAWEIPWVELVVEAPSLGALSAALLQAGAVEASRDVVETARIESGVPLFGVDMDEDTIPLEAGIEPRAISFTKGCYVGQEVIIRVLHRGHGRVARKLVRLTIEAGSEADLPAAGTPIRKDDREVGTLTSVAWSPRLGKGVALGYVRREFAEPGTRFRDRLTVQ